MRVTSINNISKIKQKRIITNSIKQKTCYDILDISFEGKRIKHSKEFLKITKDNKDLRDFITKSCMVDEHEKFSPEREELFCKTCKENESDDLTQREVLISCATAISGHYNSTKRARLEYCLKKSKELLQAGFSKEDIINIFNSEFFYIGYSEGLIYLKQILGNDFNLPDANLFLARYCLDNDGKTNPQKVATFNFLFSTLSLDNIYQADAVYNLCLNTEGEVDPTKCTIIAYIGTALLKGSYQDVKSKGEIISTLSTILSSSTSETGEIDEDKALSLYHDIGNYVIENEEALDLSLKFPVYNQTSGEVEEMTMQELRKNFPQQSMQYDNFFSKFTAMFEIGNAIKS